MFQTILKLSIIYISIRLLMTTFTIRKSSPPSPIVVLYIESIFFYWRGQTKPIKLTFSMLFVFLKVSNIYVAIWVDLDSMSMLIICLEISLIYFVFIINKHTFADSHIALDTSKIYFITVFNQSNFIDLFINYLFDINVRI